MGRVGHIVRKEFLQIRRDRPMMVLLFLIPIIQLLILGYAVATDVKNLKLAVSDGDRTPASRALADRFRHSDLFRVRMLPAGDARPGLALDRGQASLALVIPRGFEERAARALPVSLQVLMDGQDSNTATVAMGYVRGVLEGFVQDRLASAGLRTEGLTAEGLTDAGLTATGAAGEGLTAGGPGLCVIEPEVRVWYNPNLKASHFMVPGIVVFLLTMVTSLLSALGLVREKEIGTLEQLLVSPLKKHQLLMGKIVPFGVVGFVELALAVAFAWAWYRIPVVGNLGLFGVFSLVYLFTTLGIGLFVSAASKTQQQAMFLTVFLLFFFIIMSGFIFPIENMPRIMQILSYLDPLRFMLVATREIFIKGAGIGDLYGQGLALVVFSGGIFSFAVWRFQRRMK